MSAPPLDRPVRAVPPPGPDPSGPTHRAWMRPGTEERTAVAAALASLLASLTLSPLVQGKAWLAVATVLVVAVMVSGMVARNLLRSSGLVALIQAVVLLVVTLMLFARADLAGGPAAIGTLSDLLRAGLEVSRTQAPPIGATRGVVLLVAGSAGLVALLVDLLACSLRQPALAGLPLLAVYCVPAALAGGLPWYWFALAAGGFLLLLAADSGERALAWGRVLGGDRKAATAWLDVGRGGRTVGVVAVLAAVLVPLAVPGLGNRVLGGDGNGTGNGTGSISRINPILDIRKDLNARADTPLLQYRTTSNDPQPLRIVTADVFDGNRWAPNTSRIPLSQKIQTGLPAAQGLGGEVARTTERTSIAIGDALRETYLPLPYPSVQVSLDGDGDWLYDAETLNVIGYRTDTRNTRYTVEHLDVRPTVEQLAAAGSAPQTLLDRYLQLPANLPAVVGTTARSVGGSGNPYDQAMRLQRWFRDEGNFQYTTEAPRLNDDSDDSGSQAMVEFLRQRRGYCVHFASTMAVMVRSLGIPARVAIGFLPGEKQQDGVMEISSHDAHAWPELYFDGVGWVRFEPTPRAGEATPPEWATAQAQAEPEPSESAAAEPSAAEATPDAPTPAPREQDQQTSDAPDGGGIPWRPLLVVLVAVVALLAPRAVAGALAGRRRSRAALAGGPAPAEVAWDDLRLGLGDLGVTWVPSWTPRAAAAKLAQEQDLGTDGSAALGRLVDAVETARYAPPGAPGGDGTALRADVGEVLEPLASGRSRMVRLRARWFPASLVTRVREALPVRAGGTPGPGDGAAPVEHSPEAEELTRR